MKKDPLDLSQEDSKPQIESNSEENEKQQEKQHQTQHEIKHQVQHPNEKESKSNHTPSRRSATSQETRQSEKQEALDQQRVLIASPVRQTTPVLREFLDSLHALERTTVKTDYLFVDDNVEEAASNILREFVLQHEGTVIQADEQGSGNPDNKGVYTKDEGGHYWQGEQIWRVAGLKNRILQYARDKDYDAVFLIDSDLVLHPRTLEQLVSSGKDIVSNIFWTRWQPDAREMPQVWLQDEYALYRRGGKTLDGTEVEDEGTQTTAFLNQLRIPGCYEVGGLGACTLIRKNVLAAGVSYDQIPNVSFWGEDRHFCIRAQALGFCLFVDTHYPAYHIYRLSELPGYLPLTAGPDVAKRRSVLPCV
ncbi:hypothetical protein P9222_10920 [Paenibacillus amylolyticus]|nr:hypothetical protein [Paenibacillus amylolyticus]WFR64585.1 hypothetical protein P9222_10920 [Paenibacillus amylolyticus]